MNILVFGIQGSGKSTYGPYIAEKLNVPYIYTGDLFRQVAKQNSPSGREVRQLLEEGKLIPDSLAIGVIEDYINEHDISKGVVLDGYPRNLHQAENLKIEIDLVLHFTIDEGLAIERLLARKRGDDSPDVIAQRMALYRELTSPILGFFKEKGTRLVEIDNTPPVEEVKKVLNDLLEI
jgi:adenylate kinase